VAGQVDKKDKKDKKDNEPIGQGAKKDRKDKATPAGSQIKKMQFAKQKTGRYVT
jgi:hypothetical protein